MSLQLKNIIESTTKEALQIASNLTTSRGDKENSDVDIVKRFDAVHRRFLKRRDLPKDPWASSSIEGNWWAP